MRLRSFTVLLITALVMAAMAEAGPAAYAPRAMTGNASTTSSMPTSAQRPFNVFGYLPEYRQRPDFPYEAVFQQGLTHLIFFSVEIDHETGQFHPDKYTDRLPQGDQWRYVRELADAYGVKLMVCIGGGGRSSGFAPMLSQPTRRRAFVHALNEWVLSKELDGVDFNWEYPQNDAEWAGFGYLLREVRSSLGYASLPEPEGEHATRTESMSPAERLAHWRTHRLPPGELARGTHGASGHRERQRRRVQVRDMAISIALHPHPSLGPILQNNNIVRSVDFLHWMAYDSPLEGRHHSGVDYAETMLSPVYLNPLNDATYYRAQPPSPLLHSSGDSRATRPRGPPVVVDHRRKVTLGIPFYGRMTNNLAAEPQTYDRLMYFIRQWVRKVHPEWDKDGEELRRMNEYGGFNYNSYTDVQQKMALARTLPLPASPTVRNDAAPHADGATVESGIAGIMIWELGQDLQPPSTQPLSLMRAVGDMLRAWASAPPWEPFTIHVSPPDASKPVESATSAADQDDDGGDL